MIKKTASKSKEGSYLDLKNLSAVQCEEAIIGAIVTSTESINAAIGMLKPEMFYNSGLGKIYEICRELMQRGSSTDFITVTAELDRKGMNDLSEKVTELAGCCVTDNMTENHARIVLQNWMLRQYAIKGAELHRLSLEGDLEQVVKLAENEILEISGMLYTKEPQSLDAILDYSIKAIQGIKDGDTSLLGVPSGFQKLDRIIGGFQAGSLAILAGRPSHGKTAVALQIALNSASAGYPVLIFSHEMRDRELGFRYLSGSSEYSNSDLIAGDCDMIKICRTANNLLGLPIYIDDSAGMTVMEQRAKLKKQIVKNKIKFVIVDYLQLMSGTGMNREQEISSISRGLKALAKTLNVAVLALSQLNRLPEGRGDKMPMLSDLRESGAIEQDADLVLLMYRPILYKEETVRVGTRELDTRRLILMNVAKNRNGRTGTIELYHNESVTKIEEKEVLSF